MNPSLKVILRRVPFLRIFTPLILGILIPAYNSFPYNTLLFSFFICIFGILISFFTQKFTYIFGVCTFLFIFIGINIIQYEIVHSYKDLPKNKEMQFTGIVQDEFKETEKCFRTTLLVTHILENNNWTETNAKCILYIEKDTSMLQPEVGSRIVCNSFFNDINNFPDSEFDYKNYLAQKHIFSSCFVKTSHWKKLQSENVYFIKNKAIKLRSSILDIFKSHKYSREQLSFTGAILLGEKDELSDEIKKDFSKAGLMHLMAISGLHVGMVTLLLNFALSFLNKRKLLTIIKTLLLLLAIWAFAYLTGFSSSVRRAAIMFSFLSIGLQFEKNYSILNTLLASAFFTLILNPFELFSVGFQLSYFAVLGIIIVYPKISVIYRQYNRLAKYFLDIISISIAAQLLTLPLSLYYFENLPTYSLIANLVAIPLTFITISGLFIELSIGILSQYIAMYIAVLNKLFIDMILYFTHFISNLPYSTKELSLEKSSTILIYVILFFCFAVFGILSRQKERLSIK